MSGWRMLAVTAATFVIVWTVLDAAYYIGRFNGIDQAARTALTYDAGLSDAIKRFAR